MSIGLLCRLFAGGDSGTGTESAHQPHAVGQYREPALLHPDAHALLLLRTAAGGQQPITDSDAPHRQEQTGQQTARPGLQARQVQIRLACY